MKVTTTLTHIKKRQQDVVRFLEANRIEFEEVDITMSEEKRQWMYKNIPEDRQPAQGNPLPPQIFSDDRYCGDYDCFFESKESNTVFSFLGLKPSLAPKMHSYRGSYYFMLMRSHNPRKPL
uniref:SH3 domain binding glutamate rich protein like 2 n=1 Tax=Meleagris gallopavo TaxID=9103 RepID=A0A803Y480_MELGA